MSFEVFLRDPQVDPSGEESLMQALLLRAKTEERQVWRHSEIVLLLQNTASRTPNGPNL